MKVLKPNEMPKPCAGPAEGGMEGLMGDVSR